MYVVAIRNATDDEAGARALAEALGKSAYEARSRLRAPGGGPAVVAHFADGEPAADLSARLDAAGFEVLCLAGEEVESENSRFAAVRFSLTDDTLQVGTARGDSQEVSYDEIDTMISGFGIIQHKGQETVRERTFSPGLAFLTGGLKMTKVSEKKVETRVESRERFLHLYALGHLPIVLRESKLDYTSLGPRLQPSQAANFARLSDELRRRCPSATRDDRLLHRQGQAQLLGPSLIPEEHLDIAISLLAQTLRRADKG